MATQPKRVNRRDDLPSLRPVVPLAHETDHQHENAEETTETDRAVDDAKDHELRGPVCRLKGCQESKSAKGGDRKQKQTGNNEKK